MCDVGTGGGPHIAKSGGMWGSMTIQNYAVKNDMLTRPT
jgi:hypothetical protein